MQAILFITILSIIVGSIIAEDIIKYLKERRKKNEQERKKKSVKKHKYSTKIY